MSMKNSYDDYGGWHWDKMTLFRLINKYLHIVKYTNCYIGKPCEDHY